MSDARETFLKETAMTPEDAAAMTEMMELEEIACLEEEPEFEIY